MLNHLQVVQTLSTLRSMIEATIQRNGGAVSDLSTYTEALSAELRDAERQSMEAMHSRDVGEVLAALDRLTEVTRTVDSARAKAVDQARSLVRLALSLGVHYRVLYTRPLSHPIVIELAKEAGIEVTRKQPITRKTA